MGSVRPSGNLCLVNAITCEIFNPASPNSVYGFFMGRSRRSSYLSHLDLHEVNSLYQLVNAITCEIIDPALSNSVCRFFMDFNETLKIDSHWGSNMHVSKKFKRSYYALGGALV